MARNDVTNAAAQAARQAMVSAMITFVTSTLPPLHAAAAAAVNAMDPMHPTLDGTSIEDAAFYSACVRYTNALITDKRYTGSPLRYP